MLHISPVAGVFIVLAAIKIIVILDTSILPQRVIRRHRLFRVVVGFAAIHIGEVHQQAGAGVDFFTGDERPCPHQIMLTVLGFTVGHGGAHDHFAVSIEGADLEAGFGFDGFVVVGQGVETAADCAKDVDGDIDQDVGFGVGRHGGGDAAEQEIVAHQAHQEAGVGLGDGHVLVFAQAFVGQAHGFVGMGAFGLGFCTGGRWADGLAVAVVAALGAAAVAAAARLAGVGGAVVGVAAVVGARIRTRTGV